MKTITVDLETNTYVTLWDLADRLGIDEGVVVEEAIEMLGMLVHVISEGGDIRLQMSDDLRRVFENDFLGSIREKLKKRN